MNRPSHGTATHIGRTAYELLSMGQAATVMGITSRGVFLRLATEQVVFLSFEPFRGPLTINLSPALAHVNCFQGGEELVIQQQVLSLNACRIKIDLRQAKNWEAPGLPGNPLPNHESLANLRLAARQVLLKGEGIGLSRLLAGLLNLPGAEAFESGLDPVAQDLAELLQTVETGATEDALVAAECFLGMGSGLTPSGDDLLLGLVLALTRWGNRMGFDFDTLGFAGLLEGKARQMTTTLSASLLACAAQGQADERLVEALDGMLSGVLSPSACADRLLSWGSSSGCDALVGMAVGMLAFGSFRRHDVL